MYITASNLEKILYGIIPAKSSSEEKLYKEYCFDWLNDSEKRRLLLYKNYLTKDKNELLSAYKPIKKRFEYKQVFNSQYSSYHSSQECERLTSDFVNYEIPQEILNQGSAQTAKFRKWVKEHKSVIDSDYESFCKSMEKEFGVKSLVKINRQNSGSCEIENLSLIELEKMLDSAIESVDNYFNNGEPHEILNLKIYPKNSSEKLPIYKHLSFLNYDEIEIERQLPTAYTYSIIRPVILMFKALKMRALILLREFYRIKFNPDLKFDVEILDQLGFYPCSCCCPELYKNKNKDK